MSTKFEQQDGQPLAATGRKKKANSLWTTIALALASIGLWGALVFFGYSYAKDYIDTSIRNVQQENSMHIKQLTEEVQALRQEIIYLNESLISTGSTLSSSTSLQDRIDERLAALDRNLKELENSLRILKEAPSVSN